MKNLLNAIELKSKLKAMNEQGFTQIKLPGGTSRDRQHYSGLIIPYYNFEDKMTYFSGLPYNPNFHKNGTENVDNKKEGETPLQTAIREGMEEIGLIFKPEDLEEVLSAMVKIKDRVNPELILHIKHFFVAKSFSGEAFEFEGPNPIDHETAAPIWIPAPIFKEILWKGHQPAFNASFSEILCTDGDIYNSMYKLF